VPLQLWQTTLWPGQLSRRAPGGQQVPPDAAQLSHSKTLPTPWQRGQANFLKSFKVGLPPVPSA